MCGPASRLLLAVLVTLASLCGQLYCQDTSTQGLKLTLLEVATSPVSVVVQQRRSINLVEGRSYNISCNREGGFGTATSVWFKSNTAIASNTGAQVYAIMMDTNNWILVLKMFRASDVGSYTCKGTNSNVTLDIGTSNPTVIASTPQLFVSSRVVQGSRATLQAFVSGTPPPTDSDINWYFNNQSIPDGSLIDGTDLLLPRTPLPSHSGTYTIQVTTTMGTARDSFVVTVTAQPSPSISPVDNQVRVNGTSITLTCQDSQGVPAPTFSWTRGGSPLGNDDRTTITSMIDGSVTRSTLTINPLLPGDTGMYGCVAENSDGSSSAFVRVDVHFKPILEPFSTQLRWVIGSTATLQTLLYAAIPNNSITFYWTNPSSAIIDSSLYTNTTVNNSRVYGLMLPNLEKEDGGIYTCVVQNNIGTSTLTFDLFITVPPVLEHIDGSPSRRIMLGRNGASQVMLVANVKEAIPNIAAGLVSWRKGNDPVVQSAKYITTAKSSQVNLTITSLAISDSGLYTVTIVHEAGTVFLEFQLEVLDPPAPPTLLWVTPVTACTAEIIWDRNRTQPTTTAIPSYIVIEASLSRDSSAEWVQVGTADISDTSLVGRIPSGGLNTSYWLRARSGNTSVGEGENYLDPDTFYAYTEDMFPTLSSVNGEPSSDSQTIRVQWSLLPQQNCSSPSFNVLCTPLEASATSGQNRVTEDLRSALVRNLTPNTFYNCSVTVNFDGFGVSNKSYANNAIVTFPPKPSPPGVKPLGSVKPTSQTITVLFDLPLDHERISHYRVYAIRLSDRSLPPVNTNNLYKTPDDSRLSTYEAVNQPDPFDENTPPFLGYIATEIGAEEFKPLFTIGDGTQTDVAEFPNKELRPSSLYTFFLRAYPKTRGDSPSRSKRQDGSPSRQYIVFSSSVFSNIFTTDEGGPDVGGNSPATQDIVIAVVVVVVLLLLIVGIVIVVLCLVTLRSARLRTYKPGRMPSVDNSPSSTCNGSVDFIIDTPDLARKTNGIHELKELDAQYFAKSPFVPSGPIKLEKFSEHVERFDTNRQLLFQEEYEWISSNSQWHAAEASNNILNDEKNRYSNITAFDHSRVELQLRDGIECSDYINANFISGYHSEQEYIATQGPLDQTVDDFWRMVWEQNTATIIMLTNLVELGKVKCAQYWPTCGKVIYDKLIVTLENTVNLPDYTIRNLSIDHMLTGESRTVLQFHYTRWPDYHTPQLAAPLLNFLRAVNASNPEEVGPMVVHCSAGVGRSGTVIAIDYCLHKLREEKILDVRGFVSAMREQRNYMVQTAEQYTFIHYAILESNTYGDTSFSLSDFTSLYQKLREVNPESKKTQMDEEYSRLGQVKTMVKKSAFQRRLRRKGEPPRHFESSFRGTMPSVDSTDNYSGHFIDSYFEKKRFIVAEGPQESTSAKFWQVVWDEDCCMVVMLTPQDSPMFHRYWPAVGEQEQHGNVIVQVETETEEHFYTKREIKLTNAKVDGISHKLEQYQFMGWMEKDFPRVPDFVKFVCDVLECFRNIEGNKRVLMHDTDSLGPAVIMCALCYCIERLGVERMVDIFQAVQSIQLQRPGSIKTMKQYAFTYDCVYEYIRTYSSS